MNRKLSLHFLIFVSLLLLLGGLNEKEISLISPARAQTSAPDISSDKSPALTVTTAFWKKQRDKAFEKRTAKTGKDAPGIVVPKELSEGGITKQKAKLKESVFADYRRPMDYADLAEKRLNGELVEIPIATETYLLDVGGNATDEEFNSYDFEDGAVALTPDSPKYLTLKKLAGSFDGMKYDLNNAAVRRQFKIRLLRMINPQTKVVLEEIAANYHKKYKRPLRVVSMIRSMEYQILLNSVDASSFKVSDKDVFPPHLSGSAFDLSFVQMTAEEQNFVMKNLAELENAGKIDALREMGVNPVWHIFVYPDGKPPKM